MTEQPTDTSFMTVTIPACEEHEGIYSVSVKIARVCPVCGGKRGTDLLNVRSYDGSRILFVHGWHNPCGHIDKYDAVREEAQHNGLNGVTISDDEPVSDLTFDPIDTLESDPPCLPDDATEDYHKSRVAQAMALIVTREATWHSDRPACYRAIKELALFGMDEISEAERRLKQAAPVTTSA